jgi:hypothetical protein
METKIRNKEPKPSIKMRKRKKNTFPWKLILKHELKKTNSSTPESRFRSIL